VISKEDTANSEPFCAPICHRVRRAIARGEPLPGEQLSSAADVGRTLLVNVRTVLDACQTRSGERLIKLRRGRRAVVIAGAESSVGEVRRLTRVPVLAAQRAGLNLEAPNNPRRRGSREMTQPTAAAPAPENAVWSRLRRETTIISVSIAAIIVVSAAVLPLTWTDIPDRLASHWGVDGTADHFSSRQAMAWMALLLPLAFIPAFAIGGWMTGKNAAARRTFAALTVGVPAFVALALAASVWAQRGISNPGQVKLPQVGLMFAFGAALVCGIVVSALVPGDPHLPTTQPVPATGPREPLGLTERAVWSQRSGSRAVNGGLLAFLIIGAVLSATIRLWLVVTIFLPPFILMVAMFNYVTRIDYGGITVRSVIGWPRTFISATEVVQATPTTVDPLREFGGWGWRMGSSSTGIVLRRGEGLRVERTGNRSLTVTVDHATEGAALLNTMAANARGGDR